MNQTCSGSNVTSLSGERTYVSWLVNTSWACFELMITTSFVAEAYGLSTAGFGEGFLRDWWEARVAQGAIALTPDGFVHESEHWTQVLRILRAGLA